LVWGARRDPVAARLQVGEVTVHGYIARSTKFGINPMIVSLQRWKIISVGRVGQIQNLRPIDYCDLKSSIFERCNDALCNHFCFLWI